MLVACTNLGNLYLVKAVLLHLGTMYQGVLHSRVDRLQPLLEHRWSHRILRLVEAIACSILSLMTF